MICSLVYFLYIYLLICLYLPLCLCLFILTDGEIWACLNIYPCIILIFNPLFTLKKCCKDMYELVQWFWSFHNLNYCPNVLTVCKLCIYLCLFLGFASINKTAVLSVVLLGCRNWHAHNDNANILMISRYNVCRIQCPSLLIVNDQCIRNKPLLDLWLH